MALPPPSEDVLREHVEKHFRRHAAIDELGELVDTLENDEVRVTLAAGLIRLREYGKILSSDAFVQWSDQDVAEFRDLFDNRIVPKKMEYEILSMDIEALVAHHFIAACRHCLSVRRSILDLDPS